jgi:hypothetical protein
MCDDTRFGGNAGAGIAWRKTVSGTRRSCSGGNMSNVEQFRIAVIAAGAEAKGIERGPRGAERLVISTLGGLITKEVPLKGEFDQDIENVASEARHIVARAKILTAEPATKLSSRTAGTPAAPARVRA